MSVILEKYKDPKTSIGTAVTESLSHIHKYCLPLSELADDFVEALNHKNPKIKVDTAKLLQVDAHSPAFSSQAYVKLPVPASRMLLLLLKLAEALAVCRPVWTAQARQTQPRCTLCCCL